MKEHFGFIYLTTNNVNGKKYIGQCSFQNRFWKTYLGSGKHLKQAVKKYGKENFSREILQYADTREELSVLEIEFISKYNAVKDPSFYNVADGGYCTRGYLGKSHSDEYKKKMIEFSTNRPATDNMRVNMSSIGKKYGGFKHTETHRLAIQKVGISNKGRKASLEERLERSSAKSGKTLFENIIGISPDGEEFYFSTQFEIQRKFNIKFSRIYDYLFTKRSTPFTRGYVKGWIFKLKFD